MADQDKKKKADQENQSPSLDEDSFSLDLEDFDLGEDELEPSSTFSESSSSDDSIELDSDLEDMVASTSDEDDDDFLDIDLDSDLNLTDDSEPYTAIVEEEDLELEFEDSFEDIDQEIESIITNKESVFTKRAQTRKSESALSAPSNLDSTSNEPNFEPTEDPEEIEFINEEEEEGPLALSLEELDNIAGDAEEPISALEVAEEENEIEIDNDNDTDTVTESESDFSSDSDLESDLDSLPDLNIDHDLETEGEQDPEQEEDSETKTGDENTLQNDLGLDLDESPVDTSLEFDDEGVPNLDLDEESNSAKIETEPELEMEMDMNPGTELDSEIETELESDLEIESEHESEIEPEAAQPQSKTNPDKFERILDPEEEELFGGVKEDDNLTLSDDELGDILGGGDGLSLEESLGAVEEESIEESPVSEPEPEMTEEEDEPITLSLDELNEISGSDLESETTEPEPLDSIEEFGTSIEEEKDEDDGPITLSDDELGNILGEDEPLSEPESAMDLEEDLPTLEESESSDELEPEPELEAEAEELDEPEEESLAEEIFSHDEEDDEGPLALSMDELESIASSAEVESELEPESEPEEELVDSLDRNPLPYEEEEDESIALSMEELENIAAIEEEPEPESEIELIDEVLGDALPGEDLEDIGELPEEAPVSGLVGFESQSIAEETAEEIPSNATEKKTATFSDDGTEPYLIDLDDYAVDGKLSPLEDLRASQIPEATQDKTEEATSSDTTEKEADSVSSTEKKKVLSYLDNLLGNLPDQVIKDFSKSEYFELYKKMMKELGL